jgi:hypothetical protein
MRNFPSDIRTLAPYFKFKSVQYIVTSQKIDLIITARTFCDYKNNVLVITRAG